MFCRASMWRIVGFWAALPILWSFPALAESVAIFELRFSDLPPALGEQIQKRLQGALAAEGYHVVQEERAAQKMREIGVPPGCAMGACLARVASALRVQRALIGGVGSHGSSYDITLTLLEGGGGTALSQVSKRCDVCNFKELEESVAGAAKELHRLALVFLSARSILVVDSVSSEADVFIDGLPVGKTPATRILAPGRHVVEVSGERNYAMRQEVFLEQGKTRVLKVNLKQARRDGSNGRPLQHRARPIIPAWLKWASWGAGVVLGGIGGGLWAIDGHGTSERDHVHETKAAGITLVSLGTASVVGGTLLYLLE